MNKDKRYPCCFHCGEVGEAANIGHLRPCAHDGCPGAVEIER